MSSRISRDTKILTPVHDIEVKQVPVITNVLEKPLLAEVKEVKNLNVVHKDLVTEIHEQPIIEISRKPETVYVKENTIVERDMAPARFEEFGEVQHVDLNLRSNKPVEVIQQLGDVKHSTLNETIKNIETRETIERHIIPTVTEIHEQKIVNVIEQPIIRTFHETPIVREVPYVQEVELLEEKPVSTHFFDMKSDEMMRDSSLEREKMLPPVQLSTHVLKSAVEAPLLSTRTEAPLTVSTMPHLFSSAEFKNQIKNGDLMLHSAKPLSKPTLGAELMAQKALLNKSRYFSKPAFSGQFMAQKVLLKPVPNNLISEELSGLGQWKSDKWSTQLLSTSSSFLKSAYETAKGYAADTYNAAKHMTEDAFATKL